MATKVRRAPVPPPKQRRPKAFSVGLLVTFLVTGLAGAGIGYLATAPGATENAIAELRAADAKRDQEQIVELTTQAKATVTELEQVLTGLAAAVPVEQGVAPQPADPAVVKGWQEVLRASVDKHAESVSGMTATNVARGGFRSAVNTLAIAIDTYAASQALPEDARRPVLDLVARQRTAAVMMWSVAATQLDQLNVDAGRGHQHAYLSSSPGDGAMTADEVPEGTE
ncbi:hypothetical protein [Acrocarpospora catenulata]|uniref:hypothetical protein n=1 Tax=Acrocarpospora catenulata TaxID=2836182 RepID=UPI001BDAD1BE|nr:hypothetical protein [Acrocarpospora catenulata]